MPTIPFPTEFLPFSRCDSGCPLPHPLEVGHLSALARNLADQSERAYYFRPFRVRVSRSLSVSST